MADITITVSFLGELRSLVRRRQINVTMANGSTVHALMVHLSDALGDDFKSHVFDQEGRFFRHISIFVNGSPIDNTDGSQTQLSAGEVDVLMLPVYGGGEGSPGS